MSATVTVLLKENFLGNKYDGAERLRIRYSDAGRTAPELNFAKAANAEGFSSGAESIFIMDPSIDNPGLGAGIVAAKLGYKNASADKTFYSIAGNEDLLTADTLKVTSTATVANLYVDRLVATNLTVVDATQTVNLFVTSDKVVADELQVTEGITAGALIVTNAASLGSLTVTGDALIKGAATATSTLDIYGAARARSSLQVDGAATLNDAATIEGVLTVNDNVLITGQASITGGARISGGAVVTGNSSVSGTLDVSSGLAANSLEATGSATIGTTLKVVGAADLDSSVDIGGTLDVAGAGGAVLSKLRVTGTSQFDAAVTINAALTVTGAALAQTVQASGNATIGAALKVVGASQLDSTLTVNGTATLKDAVTAKSIFVSDNATIEDNLAVSGNADITGSLTVTGAAELKGALKINALDITTTATIGGNVTMSSNLKVVGTATVANLSVDSAATVGTTLAVGGAASFASNVSVVSGLSVTGGAVLSGSSSILTFKNNSGSDVAVLGIANGFNSTGSVSTLLVTGDVNLNDTLRVTGDLYANGDLEVTSTLVVHGEATVGGALRVAGPIFSTGTMYSHFIVEGATNKGLIEGDANGFKLELFGPTISDPDIASVIGRATDLVFSHTDKVIISAPQSELTGTLYITGAATVHSTLRAKQAVDIEGALSVTGVINASSGMDVTGAVGLNNALTVTGAINGMGGLNVTGAVILNSGGLTVTGAVGLNNSLDVTGILSVTGETTLFDFLDVMKGVVFHDGLNVSNGLFIDSGLLRAVEGVEFDSTASIAGNFTCSSDLNVNQSINITHNANITGNVFVTGGMDVLDQSIFRHLVTMNNLNVSENSELLGTMSVALNATFSNNITCSEDANLTRLSLSSTGVVQSTLTVQDLSVTGGIEAANYGTTSDARLKKDITEIEGALAKVQALRPVEYNWTERETLNPGHKEIGFIAQEVEAVIPAVVSTSSDELGTKRVGYDRLTALLVAAVKEQAAVIAGLEARLSALEGRC